MFQPSTCMVTPAMSRLPCTFALHQRSSKAVKMRFSESLLQEQPPISTSK